MPTSSWLAASAKDADPQTYAVWPGSQSGTSSAAVSRPAGRMPCASRVSTISAPASISSSA